MSNTAPVPLSGFLNLSAVSWQARVPRPCFMPQPFLGASLQSLPLAADRAPLSRPLAPLPLSTGVPRRTPRDLLTAPFVERPRPKTRWPDSPRRLWVPFSRRRNDASRSPWATRRLSPRSTRFTDFEAFFPSASPFLRCGEPQLQSLLSWVSAPPETCPAKPRRPVLAGPRRTTARTSALTSARDPGDLSTPAAGWDLACARTPTQPARRLPASFETGPRCPSAASPTPLTLGLSVALNPWPSEPSSTSRSTHLPKEPRPPLLGFLSSSPTS
jgi:hypothetical protein